MKKWKGKCINGNGCRGEAGEVGVGTWKVWEGAFVSVYFGFQLAINMGLGPLEFL